MMKGIISLNKPSGISSAAAVAKVRRVLGVKSAGHMGTLDPLASGVLIIGVEKACRLFNFFLKKDKVYRAIFEFGTETDTLDRLGEVTNTSDFVPSLEQLNSVLHEFKGKIMQIPPAYSAKNINGQRAYAIARKGGTVELNPSEIEIFDLKVIGQVSENAYEFEIHCSSGTYIRSLARDIAYRLNTYANMTDLIRTRSGQFTIDNSVALEELEAKKNSCLVSIEETLREMPRLELDEIYHKQLLNGVKVRYISNIDEPFLLFCGGEFFGIAIIDNDGYIKINSYLRD